MQLATPERAEADALFALPTSALPAAAAASTPPPPPREPLLELGKARRLGCPQLMERDLHCIHEAPADGASDQDTDDTSTADDATASGESGHSSSDERLCREREPLEPDSKARNAAEAAAHGAISGLRAFFSSAFARSRRWALFPSRSLA